MAPNIDTTALSKSPELSDVLTQQAQAGGYDCLPCRLMGSAVFTGMGIYSWASGTSQLRKRELEILRSKSFYTLGMRKASIWVLSGSLVSLGIYRLYN
ncbi:hypothetical protein BAUCODRAFT_126354 [Baudoinia panamericana UAMH 10762]|uniref:Distal membrane-arm assembly complex protein 1-like domain-containing protein n=1 Tax=Baudoinia panamericana (strain UAMH 10762) TaxID=717646 RepID=M2LEE2_BAUPA|nr:uncharacterized protein BAUCODRAFT_126354 [Baudoinia panamericana UAMH 10762]EMC92367.1 hypothetical protein BAUCODRAFT_126354 [Baudoinia panamericana UAMH 10762]